MPGGTRPPDKEVGGRVGLPGSLAAVVETSLQENREARPAVDNMSGEQRKGKAAAAGEDLIQVERLEEIELLEDKTPYSVVLRQKGRKGGQAQAWGTSFPEVLASGSSGVLESSQEEDREDDGDGKEPESNADLRMVRNMLRRGEGAVVENKEDSVRDGRREVRVGDWTCKTEACKGWSNKTLIL